MAEIKKEIVNRFLIEGDIKDIKPLGNGLINDTYLVETKHSSTPDYVLQRINTNVFKNVEMLQNNIEHVTNHIRQKLISNGVEDTDRRVLRFIKTESGRTYIQDNDKQCWRLSVFIHNAITPESVNANTSMNAGSAFGNFESMLIDLKEPIGETIPRFHDMELRTQQLAEAVGMDKVGRLFEVREEVELIDSMAGDMCKAEQLGRQGALPKRICHCDTKVNNMLTDIEGNVLCVIDLDTVMPSYVFSDYGDFLRTAANSVAEDESDIEKIVFREDIFQSFTTGYIRSTADFLTETERNNLHYSIALFPYMQATRFLTDYLNGDTYYKTSYPEHNLTRTRNQLELFRQILERIPKIERFIKNCG